MIENLIYVRHISAPKIDRREILRYAGVRESCSEIEIMLDKCIDEALDKLSYKACYRVFDIKADEDEIDLGFSKTTSRSLIKTLEGCDKAVVFCAKVGSELDRLVARYNVISPSGAVLLQALGSERVEALCDAFCHDLALEEEKNGNTLRPRFSPGYGDLPLDLQRDIFATLGCTKAIGITLGDNLFMNPTKSVTAIIGIKGKRNENS